jgi:HNH endonuclease
VVVARLAEPERDAMEVVLAMEASVQRGVRSKQPTWVWLIVLMAHNGVCVYCNTEPSTTLDHEAPVADNGADVWWNFVPACEPCNRWKRDRTAREWIIDQKLHRDRPRDGFDTRRMPLKMFYGFLERVEAVRREITDTNRRDWYRHHFGKERHKTKAEMMEHLETCVEELGGYPHLPWMTPNVRETTADMCTRHMCCGWLHPQARHVSGVIMPDGQYEKFRKAAFSEGMSEGDFVSKLVAWYLADRHCMSNPA